MAANDRQVGGQHYRGAMQHWDIVPEHNLDYFQGQITKYVMRWKKKNGIQDLQKAQHFLEKYIELATAGKLKDFTRVLGGSTIPVSVQDLSNGEAPTSAYVNQDR